MKKILINTLKFTLCIIGMEMLGSVGVLFNHPSIETWYKDLNKPTFTPCNCLFAPVWTFLYLTMGISFFLIWTKEVDSKIKKSAYFIFILQFILNFLWSPIFFTMKLPYLALLDISILILAILVTISKFRKISLLAGYILIPYLLWVMFATILNFYIAILN